MSGLGFGVAVSRSGLAKGWADGPLEGVRPVKYVKIEEANATTTRDPPPKQSSPPPEDKPPPAATATTSAASSGSDPMEPDELVDKQANGGGKKPKGGKPPTPTGGGGKPAEPIDRKPLSPDQCYRQGRGCCGEQAAAAVKLGGKTICPKGTLAGPSCKRRCASE